MRITSASIQCSLYGLATHRQAERLPTYRMRNQQTRDGPNRPRGATVVTSRLGSLTFPPVLNPLSKRIPGLDIPATYMTHDANVRPAAVTLVGVLTDTSDTFLCGNPANKRNYRNCSLRSNSLVTHTNTGYYRRSVVFIGTCARRR